MIRPLAIVAAVALACPASAHDFWSNGDPVPEWVRKACCGPNDVHHLKISAVHVRPDGLHIDGINTVVPIERVLPSADGEAWAFWNPALEPDPIIYCMFYPLSGM